MDQALAVALVATAWLACGLAYLAALIEFASADHQIQIIRQEICDKDPRTLLVVVIFVLLWPGFFIIANIRARY